MEFCVLSPIAGLERYATLSKTHLLLPQLQDIPGYAEFYRARRNEGDFIILDNGAYEGQHDWEVLVECIGRFAPQVVVLPDYLLQDWIKTCREAFSFLDRYYYPLHHSCEFMYVPQAEPGDIMGFIDGLYKALDDPRITWIGLPRALSYAITDDLYMRVKLAEHIKHRRGNIKLHALGMVKGSVPELSALRKSGAVNSIDSNAPVWRGWNGYSVDCEHEWPEIRCNYPAIFPTLNDELILSNLEVVGVDTANARAGSNPQREVTPHS